jgi:hypothetical protein
MTYGYSNGVQGIQGKKGGYHLFPDGFNHDRKAQGNPQEDWHLGFRDHPGGRSKASAGNRANRLDQPENRLKERDPCTVSFTVAESSVKIRL